MPSDHKGRPIGNPNTSHGGHEPTPLERWNKNKTQAEKGKDRFRGYEEEILETGGDPRALASPYLDPYDYEEPDQSWKEEQQKEKEEEWRSEAMQFGGTSTNSDSLEDTTYNHADPRNR